MVGELDTRVQATRFRIRILFREEEVIITTMIGEIEVRILEIETTVIEVPCIKVRDPIDRIMDIRTGITTKNEKEEATIKAHNSGVIEVKMRLNYNNLRLLPPWQGRKHLNESTLIILNTSSLKVK